MKESTERKPQEASKPQGGPTFKLATWSTSRWRYDGLAVYSSDGDLVARIPRSVRPVDRNKYDHQALERARVRHSLRHTHPDLAEEHGRD